MLFSLVLFYWQSACPKTERTLHQTKITSPVKRTKSPCFACTVSTICFCFALEKIVGCKFEIAFSYYGPQRSYANLW